ncbi:hypothetical protein [Serinibacter salmoneus]|uniref:Nucleic acid-binding protein n=1 Tax=Serinibacter salmoneus TaxID=556530 RepID=A0A2A9D359_9MICO|nr:hypothetical protein [Serinibacter salmoneus]PFG21137.1 hypothetical protein ATL40_2758 [Serinibacter salmoneus]
MRFAIDAPTALRILQTGARPAVGHQLVGAAALRSQVMAILYRRVRAGEMDDGAAREALESLASLKVRLLGDRVSRARAWNLARTLDLADPADLATAEIVAVALLQADVLVTDDSALADLARAAEVEVLGWEGFVSASRAA